MPRMNIWVWFILKSHRPPQIHPTLFCHFYCIAKYTVAIIENRNELIFRSDFCILWPKATNGMQILTLPWTYSWSMEVSCCPILSLFLSVSLSRADWVVCWPFDGPVKFWDLLISLSVIGKHQILCQYQLMIEGFFRKANAPYFLCKGWNIIQKSIIQYTLDLIHEKCLWKISVNLSERLWK